MRGLGVGLERAALAMLQTMGAGKASLLVPQPAVAGGQTGLGMTAPLVNEVEMEPVLLHTPGLRTTGYSSPLYAMVTQCTVRKALESAGGIDSGEGAIKQTLETSLLRVGETEYRIVSVTVKWISGTELLYELEIEE
jgi:hypothetical protein